ncbi:MAG: guanylate kinase [Bacteroidales bacterium]|nr:guanylate kinase [Bacteroidales bacterium]
MEPKVVIFSAPSGAGKTTIVKHLLAMPKFNLSFSISACSRKMRNGEVNGRDYYFLSAEEFRKKISNEEFLEWEEVYTDHFYGSLKSEVERLSAAGKVVVFDVDVKGGMNIKKFYGSNALSVFVKPPSVEVLEQRLRDRSTDSEEAIKTRIDKALYEISFAENFDHILVNDKLEDTFREAEELLSKFLGIE